MSSASASLPYGRDDLIADLMRAHPLNAKEQQFIAETLAFVRTNPNPFDRTNLTGHVTGAAFLISPDGTNVLLTHHAILNRWLPLGGHADGNPDIRAVALREAHEESGKDDIALMTTAILDVDVHAIPANPSRGEPAHVHYDIRYLLLARDLSFTRTAESKDLQWVPLTALLAPVHEEALQRLAFKALAILKTHRPQDGEICQ